MGENIYLFHFGAKLGIINEPAKTFIKKKSTIVQNKCLKKNYLFSMFFIFDFKGLKRHTPSYFSSLTHPPCPLSLKKRGGISMNFFIIFPLSNFVREGELKGGVRTIVQNK
jgi:hypothetical protein